MAQKLHGAVYAAPTPNLPTLVVVFRPEGEVMAARVAPSVDTAESFLQRFMERLQIEHDQKNPPSAATSKPGEK